MPLPEAVDYAYEFQFVSEIYGFQAHTSQCKGHVYWYFCSVKTVQAAARAINLSQEVSSFQSLYKAEVKYDQNFNLRCLVADMLRDTFADAFLEAWPGATVGWHIVAGDGRERYACLMLERMSSQAKQV